jgi:xanthine dehydrogenase small subunit
MTSDPEPQNSVSLYMKIGPMHAPSPNKIHFVLDDEIHEVARGIDPGIRTTTTVLDYLRSLPGHKGVKEGCAEGDCGACTVVIAQPGATNRLIYRAVDSCLLFLPMIHGKQLITIENLAVREGGNQSLHPVQQALVDHHGTQCGFCTPGMVMSMFALWKNHRNADDSTIREALAGNLCRCTGYQSILDAMRQSFLITESDHFNRKEPQTLLLLQQIRKDKTTLEFATKDQRYFKPFTLAESSRILKENPGSAVVSGCTDMALKQTKKGELLSLILDLSDVEDLNYLKDEIDQWRFGSGLTLETLKEWSQENLPAMNSILRVFGSQQIRNLATLGGNIGSASPIGDLLPLLLVLEAGIVICSPNGSRTIPFAEFITGYRQTALQPDELIKEVFVKKTTISEFIRTYKVSKRTDVDISTVSAAFRLVLDKGVVSEISLAFGGMADRPLRAGAVENFLTRKPWNRETVESAMEIVKNSFTPISDARAGAAYRTAVAANLLMKFYLESEPSSLKP